MITTLRELISALDRRVPHLDRPGELLIAREAQTLRREAVAQIEALSQQRRWDDTPYDQERVEAIMTDDGGPPPQASNSNRVEKWIAAPIGQAVEPPHNPSR